MRLHHGVLSIDPDPARVRVGEDLSWSVHYRGYPIRRLLWRVYFDHGTPFKSQIREFRTVTVAGEPSPSGSEHSGTIQGEKPEHVAEYKYGVQAKDADTGATIADDDPFLIVHR